MINDEIKINFPIDSEHKLFKLMWQPSYEVDTIRLEKLAKDYIPLASQKDNFYVSRDELAWLFNMANIAYASINTKESNE